MNPTVCASEEITISELKREGDAKAQFPTNNFHTAQEINDLATEVLELSRKLVKQDNISQRAKEEISHFHDMLSQVSGKFPVFLKQIVTPYSCENGLNTVRAVTFNMYHSLPAFRITTYTAVVMFSKNKERVESRSYRARILQVMMGLFEYTRVMVTVSVMHTFPDSSHIKGFADVMLFTKS